MEPRICFTYHGLKVDGETRVLDGDGQRLAGRAAAYSLAALAG